MASLLLFKSVILLIEVSVKLKVLSFGRLNLGTATFSICSAVVVHKRSRLGSSDASISNDLLIFPLNRGGISRSDLTTRRGSVKFTVSFHSLILCTFLDDIEAKVSLCSVSKVSESLSFRGIEFGTSTTASSLIDLHAALRLCCISVVKGFLCDMVIRETIRTLNSSEFNSH